MIAMLQQVLERAYEHLLFTLTTYLPPLLTAATILVITYLIALLARWVLVRIFKGISVDRFLYQSGISSMFDRSGRLRATHIVSNGVYWIIIGIGALTALSAFNTELTSRMVETAVFLFPKLVTAGLIVLAGVWLAQYLGRGVLVWGCNEGVPSVRTIAALVRAVVVFVAVVVAADHLNFARSVFLAAFVLLVGGAVLAASIAVGFGARGAVARHLEGKRESQPPEAEHERSLWNHL